MKQEEALEHLRAFMITLQKYRSTTAVEIPDLTEESKAEMWPWVFGDKCPLPMLSKIVSNVEDGGRLEPLDYYNMMFVLYRFCPEILVIMELFGSLVPEEMPPVSLLAEGWKNESR